MSDKVKYRVTIPSFLKLTDLQFTMSDIVHFLFCTIFIKMNEITVRNQVSKTKTLISFIFYDVGTELRIFFDIYLPSSNACLDKIENLFLFL